MTECIYFLDLDDVLESHAFQIETYGGDSGLRDVRLLESAVAQPPASFADEYLRAFPFEMAAAYLFHLVMNHPFVDGNKRVGLECALTFLKVNGIEIDSSDDALVELVINTTVIVHAVASPSPVKPLRTRFTPHMRWARVCTFKLCSFEKANQCKRETVKDVVERGDRNRRGLLSLATELAYP